MRATVCIKGGAAGCYATVSWKVRGLRGGELIRSEERSVNCRCREDEPACGKGCQLGLMIAGVCVICSLQPHLCIPAGLGLGLGY